MAREVSAGSAQAMSKRFCSRCRKPIEDNGPDITVEEGPIKIKIVKIKDRPLCPYCFAVLDDADERWLPIAGQQKKDKP